MSSKFKKAVEYIAKLQGIGPRQATRIALAVLNWPKEEIARFSEVIFNLSEGVSLCQECFNFSEDKTCRLCSDPKREHGKICVVEKITDLEAIEKTGLYRGVYHVLGGAINPLEGSLPQNLKIKELENRIKNRLADYTNGSKEELEIIIATNPQTTGETTALYLEEVLKPIGIKITRLAKGLASGSTLEYADAATLHHAFKNRK
ncbi:MAG: recombination protein RecR [Parcubacteria group bacterium Gr01-1014_44]|nr:MAG: recombination protein RecR [Parcubacteria group bacterium Gr01-1014_44]